MISVPVSVVGVVANYLYVLASNSCHPLCCPLSMAKRKNKKREKKRRGRGRK
jgi:hypothetical protein